MVVYSAKHKRPIKGGSLFKWQFVLSHKIENLTNFQDPPLDTSWKDFWSSSRWEWIEFY